MEGGEGVNENFTPGLFSNGTRCGLCQNGKVIITVHLCFFRSRSSVNVSPHPSHCRSCCGLSALRTGFFSSCAASVISGSLVRFSVSSGCDFLVVSFFLLCKLIPTQKLNGTQYNIVFRDISCVIAFGLQPENLILCII